MDECNILVKNVLKLAENVFSHFKGFFKSTFSTFSLAIILFSLLNISKQAVYALNEGLNRFAKRFLVIY